MRESAIMYSTNNASTSNMAIIQEKQESYKYILLKKKNSEFIIYAEE